MRRTLPLACSLVLALTCGGCTLIMGGLDDREPGSGDQNPGGGVPSNVNVDSSGLASFLDGLWMTECIPGSDDSGRRYTLAVVDNGDNDIDVQLDREEIPGCEDDGEIWAEFMSGSVRAIDPGALGHGPDAFGVAFRVDSQAMQFYDADAAEQASADALFGKRDWESGTDVDLINDVDVGEGALSEGDLLGVFIFLDAQNELRMSRPAEEPPLDDENDGLELAGADMALIGGTFTKQ